MAFIFQNFEKKKYFFGGARPKNFFVGGEYGVFEKPWAVSPGTASGEYSNTSGPHKPYMGPPFS